MTALRAWQAAPSEAGAVARLIVAFRDHRGGTEPSDETIREGVDRLIEQTDAEFLLAGPDPEAPAGICQLRYRLSLWTGAPDCWLEDLFVAEGARRAGLGAALVEAALERARAHGCRRIELDTSEDNEAALALYRRFGFSERSKRNPGRDLFLGRRLD